MGNTIGSSQAVTAGIDTGAVDALAQTALSWRYKAVPAAAHGLSAAAYLAGGVTLAQLQTPLLTLDAAALDANARHLAHWCAAHGVQLAPHGKTTMAPQLWREQLAHGAWGITLANAAQLRVAHAFGVRRVMLANTLSDPQAIAWVAATSGPDFAVVSWVDSLQTVALLSEVLAATPDAVLDVVLELGGPGGRTGIRADLDADALAHAIQAAPQLRLVGVGGYEGALAHTADAAALATVRGYLLRVQALHERLLAADLYAPATPLLLTAGGSAYFDDVVDVLGACVADGTAGPRVDLVVRSGAYLVHDDGFYRGISPFSRGAQAAAGESPLVSAMHAWARVVSVPEPGLALLDAGKRDVPVDEGLPEPQLLARQLGGTSEELHGAHISAVNDQHSFLRFDPATTTVSIGDVVRLGLSHPCTAFDKWTLIPVLADTRSDQRVVDLIHTFF